MGFSRFSSGLVHAFLWQNGVTRDLGTLPGDSDSAAEAINDKGQVVGDSTADNYSTTQAFLWQYGVLRDLGNLLGRGEGSGSGANAINDKGQVIVTEESYTSKASFLDADPLPVHGAVDIPAFSGRRVKRGLYRAADGRHINADVNGSYNTIRKVAPDAFARGSRGCVVHPIRLAV